MNKVDLYSAFDDVLRMIKQGHSKEECLQRYPQHAKDLREILDIAVELNHLKPADPDQEVILRNKARVLLAASTVRANDVQRFKKNNDTPLFGRLLRLSATIAMLAGLLVTSGTGLVNASSTALPGDNLYPVKRGWENVLLTFVFSDDLRNELENKFEEERYEEINKLYEEDRFEVVTFTGVIDEIGTEHIVIGGLFIKLDDDISNISGFKVGDMVTVIGETDDGEIKAEELHPVVSQSAIPPTNTLIPLSTSTRIPFGTLTLTTTATVTPTYIPYVTPTKDLSKNEEEKKDDDDHEIESEAFKDD